MTPRPLIAVLVLAAAPALAADVEIEGRVGAALPTYSQSFAYDSGSFSIVVPGLAAVDLRQTRPFQLDGSGGATLGGSLTLYPSSVVGIEARFDSAAVQVDASGAVYHATANLPFPLPDLSEDLTIEPAVVNVDRLQPVSLNLKVRTPGRIRLTLSGGVSYLPTIHVAARQPIRVAASGSLDPLVSQLTAGNLVFSATVAPQSDQGSKRVGGNVGGGLQVALGSTVSLTVEGRVFAFPKHQLEWQPSIEGPLSFAEQALLESVQPRLQPVEFNPTFFQVTAGIALRL